MTWNLGRFITAVAIAIIVAIVLIGLLGPILVDMKVDIATTVGKFFENWGGPLGIVAGIFYYFGYNV